MDLEEAKEFKERCTQCAAVSWGLTDEGKYYCTSCHNVTDYWKYALLFYLCIISYRLQSIFLSMISFPSHH
uniref:TATA-box binding protein associated factor, RNA polymerase I subunit B n=1 Tax=Propithecus coquereli TaxID=379532 RepID=A0A2K6FP21_PROCO